MEPVKLPKKQLILTSLLTLFPILAGLLLWNRLPQQVPTHFNFEGAADGYSGKPFAVFGLPAFLLAVHLLCAAGVSLDPRGGNVSRKIAVLVLWICPAVSLFTEGMIYLNALGIPADNSLFGMLLTGAVFVIVGNYLPKCRQNYTVGIKLPWTLADEENWNRTHRMAGPLWMAGGCILLLDAFLQIATMWVFLTVTVLLGTLPVLFSAVLYLRAKQRA